MGGKNTHLCPCIHQELEARKVIGNVKGMTRRMAGHTYCHQRLAVPFPDLGHGSIHLRVESPKVLMVPAEIISGWLTMMRIW